MGSGDDLLVTKRLVEAQGQRCVARTFDVCDGESLRVALAKGVDERGQLTTVCANAGIMPMAVGGPSNPFDFQDVVDVDLGGVMSAVTVAIPNLLPRATARRSSSPARPRVSCPAR